MIHFRTSLFIGLAGFCTIFQAQNLTAPGSEQSTTGFVVPPNVAATFKTKYSGSAENWKALGNLYAVSFRQPQTNLEKTVVFDKDGIYRGHYEQLQKTAYPKTIDEFFEDYYPSEKYTVWQMYDSSQFRYYYTPVSDTLWFTQKGEYTWPYTPGSNVSENDIELLAGAAADQILDVTLAQLAAVNANSPEVKNMASRRDSNNFEMQRHLKNVSGLKHVHLPTELDAKQQKILADLNKLQGQEFDKAYTKYLLKADRKSLARVKKINKYANDPQMQEWIRVTKKLSDENATLAKQAYCSVK